MAGHSKWANIRRRKEAQDSQKNKARTRMIREIMVAVQQGGLDNNPRLQLAMQNAKKANVPKGKIEEAIQRASSAGGDNYDEVLYEAYAPLGIALVIETLTDNNRRTVAAVRSVLTKYNGKLTPNGTLSHLFARKGVFTLVNEEVSDMETLTFELLEAGIDSIEGDETHTYLTCPLSEFNKVQATLSAQNVIPQEASLQYIAASSVPITPDKSERIEKIIQALEQQDDVQHVYDNMDIQEA